MSLVQFWKLPPSMRANVVRHLIARVSFSTCSDRRAVGHENPLGLPRTGTPPNLAARMKRGLPEKRPIPNVKKVIAVSSAKGGVGKSTIAVNLALALSRQGLHTGILDTDIYGPSIPTLLNLENLEPSLDPQNRLLPLTAYGLQAMSMGFLVPASQPIAWRGLMLQKALTQLLFEVAWPASLDVLVLDLPPGTGDVQLTVTQSVELAGAVVVSTPQALARRDAARGLALFRTIDVPVLGLVQNMSGFTCTQCGAEHDVFGKEGARETCAEWGVEFLGNVPLHASIAGEDRPTMVLEPESVQGKAFAKVADGVLRRLGMEG